ncbi:hypothetical protein Hanom_Chr05g00470271 [Helianthus anomalus]
MWIMININDAKFCANGTSFGKYCSTNVTYLGAYLGVFKKLVARSSLEKNSKKAWLEIGSVVNEPAWLGSVCKRAELELGLTRLVSS